VGGGVVTGRLPDVYQIINVGEELYSRHWNQNGEGSLNAVQGTSPYVIRRVGRNAVSQRGGKKRGDVYSKI